MTPSSTLFPVSQIHDLIAHHFDFSIKDNALNGLQIQNLGFVKKIISAVDASLELLEKTSSPQTLYLVHHGLFWGQPMPILDPFFSFLKKIFSLDSALYTLHLPLDVHPLWGNNALLAQKIGLSQISFAGSYKDVQNIIAFGHLSSPQNQHDFAFFLQQTVGKLHFLFHGPSTIKNVAICSGGGLFALHQAKKLGFDSLITGDACHTAYHASKELHINVFSCGHYNSEIYGVQHLGKFLSKNLGIHHEFFDLPTRL